MLRILLRRVCSRNLGGFVLRPSTIRTHVSRIGRRCGGLMIHRERGKRRGLWRLRRLFEGTHPELRLRRGRSRRRIRSGHLRSGFESETLRFGNLERSFGRLPTLRQTYRFRIFLWLVNTDHGKWRFPVRLGRIRSGKRTLRLALCRNRERRRLGGTGSTGGRGWSLVGFENSSWCAHDIVVVCLTRLEFTGSLFYKLNFDDAECRA